MRPRRRPSSLRPPRSRPRVAGRLLAVALVLAFALVLALALVFAQAWLVASTVAHAATSDAATWSSPSTVSPRLTQPAQPASRTRSRQTRRPSATPRSDGAIDAGVRQFDLPNGMVLIVAERPDQELAAVNLTVHLGSLDDPPAQSGLAHLLEHVTLSGSTRIGSLDPAAEGPALAALDAAHAAQALERAKPQPDRAALAALDRQVRDAQQRATALAETGEILGGRLEARGAVGLNATTTADVTQFFTWIPRGDVELWLSLEAERLRRPVLRRFYSEREVVLREVEGLTGGRPTLQERFLQTLAPDGAAPGALAGKLDTIRAIDRPAAFAYFRQHYRPDAITIAIVGDVDPASMHRLCLRYFGDWTGDARAEAPSTVSSEAPSYASPDAYADDGGTRRRAPAAANAREKLPPRSTRDSAPRSQPAFAGAALPRVGAFNSSRNPVVMLACRRPSGPIAAAAIDALAELINTPEISPLHERLIARTPLAWSVRAVPAHPSQGEASVFLLYVYGQPGVPHRRLAEETAAALDAIGTRPEADLTGAILAAQLRLAEQIDDAPAFAALLGLRQAVNGDWRVPLRRMAGLRALRPSQVRAVAQEMCRGLASSAATLETRN